MKIVINRGTGGFGLSHTAIMMYAELAGFPLYSKWDAFGLDCDYYTVPIDVVNKLRRACMEKRDFTDLNKISFGYWSIERNDPNLVSVVERLGKSSWGVGAKLKIVEIPDDVKWQISENECGVERVEEVHRTWS